jgi:hypothetical protein
LCLLDARCTYVRYSYEPENTEALLTLSDLIERIIARNVQRIRLLFAARHFGCDRLDRQGGWQPETIVKSI